MNEEREEAGRRAKNTKGKVKGYDGMEVGRVMHWGGGEEGEKKNAGMKKDVGRWWSGVGWSEAGRRKS